MGGEKAFVRASRTDLNLHFFSTMGAVAKIECLGPIQIDSAVDITAGEMNAKERAPAWWFTFNVATIASRHRNGASQIELFAFHRYLVYAGKGNVLANGGSAQ